MKDLGYRVGGLGFSVQCLRFKVLGWLAPRAAQGLELRIV